MSYFSINGLKASEADFTRILDDFGIDERRTLTPNGYEISAERLFKIADKNDDKCIELAEMRWAGLNPSTELPGLLQKYGIPATYDAARENLEEELAGMANDDLVAVMELSGTPPVGWQQGAESPFSLSMMALGEMAHRRNYDPALKGVGLFLEMSPDEKKVVRGFTNLDPIGLVGNQVYIERDLERINSSVERRGFQGTVIDAVAGPNSDNHEYFMDTIYSIHVTQFGRNEVIPIEVVAKRGEEPQFIPQGEYAAMKNITIKVLTP